MRRSSNEATSSFITVPHFGVGRWRFNVISIDSVTLNMIIWLLTTATVVDYGIDAKKENRNGTFILFSILVPIITGIVVLGILCMKL